MVKTFIYLFFCLSRSCCDTKTKIFLSFFCCWPKFAIIENQRNSLWFHDFDFNKRFFNSQINRRKWSFHVQRWSDKRWDPFRKVTELRALNKNIGELLLTSAVSQALSCHVAFIVARVMFNLDLRLWWDVNRHRLCFEWNWATLHTSLMLNADL